MRVKNFFQSGVAVGPTLVICTGIRVTLIAVSDIRLSTASVLADCPRCAVRTRARIEGAIIPRWRAVAEMVTLRVYSGITIFSPWSFKRLALYIARLLLPNANNSIGRIALPDADVLVDDP
jgi:hypothetical protein